MQDFDHIELRTWSRGKSLKDRFLTCFIEYANKTSYLLGYNFGQATYSSLFKMRVYGMGDYVFSHSIFVLYLNYFNF